MLRAAMSLRYKVIIPYISILSLFSQTSFAQNSWPDPKIGISKNPPEFLSHPTLHPTQDTVLSPIGRWTEGSCSAVDISGGYVFAGNGLLFQTLDISKRDTPRVVAQVVTLGHVDHILVRGNYAYIGSPFQVIDISDPLSPKIVASINLDALRITIDSAYAYLGDLSGSIYIVDITDPTHPLLRSTNFAFGKFVTGIAVKEPYLYVNTATGGGMDIFNIQNKDSIVYVASSMDIQEGSPLTIVGSLLYANQLTIFDLNTPENPKPLGSLGVPGKVHSITIKDSLAFLSMGPGGLAVANIADKANPKAAASIDWIGYTGNDLTTDGPIQTAVTDGFAYVAATSGFWTVEMRLDSLDGTSFLPTNNRAIDVAADSGKLYVASFLSGVNILDTTDPSVPARVGNIRTISPAWKTVVRAGIAYVLCGYYFSQDLIIADVSNPGSPTIRSRTTFHDTTNSIGGGSLALSGTYAYFSLGTKIIEIVNVVDPIRPDTVGRLRTVKSIAGLAISGSFLYAAELSGGLAIYDISKPSTPQLVDSITGNALGVSINGNLLIVADDQGIVTFDISSQTSPPIRLGSVSLPGSRSVVNLTSLGNFVYAPISTFYSVDISNPQSPKVVGSENNGATCATETGNLVVACNPGIGLLIYRNNLVTGVDKDGFKGPPTFQLLQNYPNPFNPTTVFSFTLNRSVQTTLTIYDLLGSEVRSLVDEVKPAGSYTVTWDGKDARGNPLATGAYFYRLVAVGLSQTKKAVLIR